MLTLHSAVQIPQESQQQLTVTSGSNQGEQEPDVGCDADLRQSALHKRYHILRPILIVDSRVIMPTYAGKCSRAP